MGWHNGSTETCTCAQCEARRLYLSEDQRRAEELEGFLRRNGYYDGTMTLDGGVVFIRGTAAGEAHLCVSPSTNDNDGISDIYSYPTLRDARLAWLGWDFKNFAGEPEGWVRHQPSNRRRTNGDPATEEVRP